MFGPRQIFHYLQKGGEKYHACVTLDIHSVTIVISEISDINFRDIIAASSFKFTEDENLLELILKKIDDMQVALILK